METELTPEQRTALPCLLSQSASRIRDFIAAIQPGLTIIRPGEFCLSPTFANDLNLDTITLIYKVLKGGADPHRVEYLSRCSEEALLRNVNRGDAYALKRAIAYGSLSVYLLDKEMPERGIVVSALGRVLRQLWNVEGKDEQLDDAIYYFGKTVEVEREDEPNRALHLDDLAWALMNRYKKGRREGDFEGARRAFEKAVGTGHDATPAFWSGLGQLLLERAKFEKPKEAGAFDKCIEMFKKAIESITEQFRGSVSYVYYHLGHAYTNRYLASQDQGDWQKAEGSFEEAAARLVPHSPNQVSISYGIGRVYSDLSGQYGRLEDSEKAEKYYRLALESGPGNPTAIASLAEELRYRASCTGSQKDLEEAIELIRKAVQASSATDSDLPFRLGRRAAAHADRFLILGNIDDIDQAILSLRKCFDAPGLKETDRWQYLEQLSHALLTRYEHVADIEDLQNAEMSINSALDFEGLQPGDKSTCLRVSGKIYFRKYKVDQDLEMIEKSIEKYEESINLAKAEDTSVYSTINDLGNAFLEKFEMSKSNADLQSAAKSYRDALEKLRMFRSKSARNDEAMLLQGIGNVQIRQFQLWSRTSDLDTAISYYKKSLDATPDFSVKKATRTGSLVWALLQRWDIIKKIEDLEDAERRLGEVLPLQLPPSSKALVEDRMGVVHLFFYFHTKDASRLESAAMHFRNALAAGPIDSAGKVSAAANLAKTLKHKADVTKSDVDIMAASTQYLSLLQLVKQSDPEMGSIFTNVAEFFSSVHEIKKDPTSGKMALTASLLAVKAGRVAPRIMIDTKMKAARLSFTVGGDATAACNILKLAIDDLPGAILAGMTRRDQLRLIRDCTWLPSHAAAFSIEAGNSPEDSLKLFESSRSIIWDNLLNERPDIGVLEDHHPELASRLKNLQARLAKTMPKTKFAELEPALMRQSQDHHQASLDYNNFLKEIRSLQGFKSFLRLPQESSSLVHYADAGPIIIVNSSEFRSDCFIIKRQEVVSIPLPEMTFNACVTNGASFLIALSELENNPEEASRKFEEVLLWLWNAVAEPIMKELGFLGNTQREADKPRVWWMATGWIGMLPIHAAGDHKKALGTGEPCSVLDLTVSSYFNSLRSLQYVRDTFTNARAISKESNSPRTALLVKMPKTRDNSDLPCAAEEVSHVREILAGCDIDTKVMENPESDEILEQFKKSDIVHFACHGIANSDDPSLSMVLLRDWKTRPLNVRALLQLKGLNCKLVFLSACESAVSKDRALREEGIHLSGGFQMAGVPHVVGTLWKIDDAFSVQVAEKFYSGVQAAQGLDLERSAEALRKVVIDARSRGVEALLWAAYIHSGP
jgi:tetratricopeptide (TPR) repeat protein